MERSDWSMASGLERMERSDWSRGDEGMERMERSCACVRALCMDVYENLPCPTVGCVVLKELKDQQSRIYLYRPIPQNQIIA